MGLSRYKGRLINDDRYSYPSPEIIIQTTRNITDIQHLGFDQASNENGYIYFYADADWKNNPSLYIGESKNSLKSRHNGTHKNTPWFKGIQYPFIGIINSPNKPWDTDTRRAIESLTVHKAHLVGFRVVNSPNSTWSNGGTVHPNVNRDYVDAVSEVILEYLIHHIGWGYGSKNRSPAESFNYKLPEVVESKDQDLRKQKAPAATLSDLVRSGYLVPGTISSLLTNYPGTAELTAEGIIMLDGVGYASPSAAAIALARKTNPEYSSANGWISWEATSRSGETQTIGKARDQYKQDKAFE